MFEPIFKKTIAFSLSPPLLKMTRAGKKGVKHFVD
jgi:hypothetical protein